MESGADLGLLKGGFLSSCVRSTLKIFAWPLPLLVGHAHFNKTTSQPQTLGNEVKKKKCPFCYSSRDL